MSKPKLRTVTQEDEQVIHFVEKNRNTDVGVLIRKYEGHDYLEIREFYFDRTTGDPLPTKKGVMLRLSRATELHAALGKLLEGAGVLSPATKGADDQKYRKAMRDLKVSLQDLQTALDCVMKF